MDYGKYNVDDYMTYLGHSNPWCMTRLYSVLETSLGHPVQIYGRPKHVPNPTLAGCNSSYQGIDMPIFR